ncbi:hypothetical protein DY000_02018606 [Brassica cretica]|uniref:Uncharacterized protein n=1 Tax=Brassica cretica TaxID=69181 RepID=A0ABQ7CVG5_BRACR|nr:hypothetical protein DY000_02018606 [Brassica cretica]
MKLFSYRRFVSGVFQPDSGLSDRFLFPESHFSFGGLPALPPTSLHSSSSDERPAFASASHLVGVDGGFSPVFFPVLFQSTVFVASSSN